ncbi:hypothetical protein IEQ34_020892 [Dendrobium chrysotoxum]|uniref:Uncharacterized protein n=1 Tax=Dendrobium chrysotoxum TaxID=161865 RepID=A0AAV7G375_DENCH|nr:hypothetical protein IEQ34_020892 [Dendrobium chrysotoxum]
MAPEGTDLAAAVGLCVDRVWEEEMGLSCGALPFFASIQQEAATLELLFPIIISCSSASTDKFSSHLIRCLSTSTATSSPARRINFHHIHCLSTVSATSSSPARRTANYKPTIWDDSYIQSLPIDFMKSKEEMFRNQFNCPMMVLLIVEHTKESNRYNI